MDMMDSDANTVLHSVTKGVHVGPPPVWPDMDNVTNASMFDESNLPYDMKFNEGHVVAIVTYSILMVVSAIGNITVLTIILKRRRKAGTRIHAMLMHLAIADLLVTFLMMPLEITWAWTVQWVLGDPLCRIMSFFRIFGLYLSSFILICISVDRYLAVLQPMRLYQMDRRGKLMIAVAWIASVICSLPQTYIFHVERHPNATWYEQCVTYNAFSSKLHELAYLYFGMFMMYWLPLIVILFCYASIIIEIYRRSRESICGQGTDNVRRLGFLGRAKSRTLKMTIIIVIVFVVCWTPYYIMAIWYWTDHKSAQMVDQKVQHALFMFACTNSCMNPIVYGAFNIRTRRTLVTQISLSEPFISKQLTNMRIPISKEERLTITLRYLATGTHYTALHFEFLAGVSTIAKIVQETCDVLWKVLQPLEMAEPTTNDWLDISKGFYEKTNFPNTVGAGVGESVASVRVVTWHKLTVRTKANRKSTIGNKAALFKSTQNGNTNDDVLVKENVTVTTTLCNDSDINDKNT